MRDDLERQAPSPPPHSRFFFAEVPSNAGFLTEGAPALRVWYGDSTLSGGFFRDYTRPRPGRGAATDRFFRYDSLAGLVEVVPGDTTRPVIADEPWSRNVRELGATFARAGEWDRSAIEFERLARAHPGDPAQAIQAGVAHAMAGDTARAVEWIARAGADPQAPDSVRTAAGELLRQLRPGRPAGPATHPVSTGR
jgi:hypothetical protein